MIQLVVVVQVAWELSQAVHFGEDLGHVFAGFSLEEEAGFEDFFEEVGEFVFWGVEFGDYEVG